MKRERERGHRTTGKKWNKKWWSGYKANIYKGLYFCNKVCQLAISALWPDLACVPLQICTEGLERLRDIEIRLLGPKFCVFVCGAAVDCWQKNKSWRRIRGTDRRLYIQGMRWSPLKNISSCTYSCSGAGRWLKRHAGIWISHFVTVTCRVITAASQCRSVIQV